MLHIALTSPRRTEVGYLTPFGKGMPQAHFLDTPWISPFASPNPVIVDNSTDRRTELCHGSQSAIKCCAKLSESITVSPALATPSRHSFLLGHSMTKHHALSSHLSASALGKLQRLRSGSDFGSLSPLASYVSIPRTLPCSPIGTAQNVALMATIQFSTERKRNTSALGVYNASHYTATSLISPRPSSPVHRKTTKSAVCSPHLEVSPAKSQQIKRSLTKANSPTESRHRPPRRPTTSGYCKKMGIATSSSPNHLIMLTDRQEESPILEAESAFNVGPRSVSAQGNVYNLTYTCRRSAVISRLTFDDEEDVLVTNSISGHIAKSDGCINQQHQTPLCHSGTGERRVFQYVTNLTDKCDTDHILLHPNPGRKKGNREHSCLFCAIM